jgi:hypothetical protein
MKTVLALLIVSVLERKTSCPCLHNSITQIFQALFEEKRSQVLLKKMQPLINFIPCSFQAMQTIFNLLSWFVVWRRRWKANLKRFWIHKFEMQILFFLPFFCFF